MKLGFLCVRNLQPEKHTFVTWVSGVIPWSLATHVELGTWVSLSRAGVPKLIASSFCFSWDSGVGKSEVLTWYFLQHEAERKGNILDQWKILCFLFLVTLIIHQDSKSGSSGFLPLTQPFPSCLVSGLLSWELHYLCPWAVQSFTQTFGFSASSQYYFGSH